jgi:predicted RNA-binding protein with PIN domain
MVLRMGPGHHHAGAPVSHYTQERAQQIRATLETDIRSTLVEHNIHYSPHESLELQTLVDALVVDAMARVEPLLMEVTW